MYLCIYAFMYLCIYNVYFKCFFDEYVYIIYLCSCETYIYIYIHIISKCTQPKSSNSAIFGGASVTISGVHPEEISALSLCGTRCGVASVRQFDGIWD